MNAVVAADYAVPEKGCLISVDKGIFWLRMPLPFELDHINLYLLEDGDGWVVLDCGVAIEKTYEVWESIFAQYLRGLSVKKVVATHSHVDHLGAAGWLCQRWRVPLYITQPEFEYASQYLNDFSAPADAVLQEQFDFYHRLGLSCDEARPLMSLGKGIAGLFTPLPEKTKWLTHGDELPIGDSQWRVIVSDGHSIAHASLYCAKRNILISGDQVLPRISSNVSTRAHDPEGNPLAHWLHSMQVLRGLPDDTLVLPAHEYPFRGLYHRLDQLADGHQKTLYQLLDACNAPKDVVTLVGILYPRKLSSFDLLLACGECLAHLNYLLASHQIRRDTDGKGVYQYTTVERSS